MLTSGDILLLVCAFLAVVVVDEVLARKGVAWGLVARRDLLIGKKVPTAAGLGFLPGLVVAAFLLAAEGPPRAITGAAALVAAMLVLAAVGFIDDVADLRPAVRLGAEVIVAGAAALLWCGPAHPDTWAGSTALIVGTINLVNFTDNMDGLAAALTATTAVGGLVLVGALDHDLTLAMALVLAVCGAFMIHNRPAARLHMGDTGSMSLGFVVGLALVALLMVSGQSVAPAGPVAGVGLLLGVMLIDGVQVILARALLHRPLMPGDRRHLSHRLLKIVGGSKWKMLVVLWAAQAAFVAAGVTVFRRPGLWVAITVPMIAVAVGLVAWLWRVPGDEYPKAPPADMVGGGKGPG